MPAPKRSDPIEAEAVEKDHSDEKPSPTFVPPIILRNKGVPIILLRLENGVPVPRPADLDAEDDWDPPVRTFYLRFTANHVADIEEAFDGFRAMVPIIDRKVSLGSDGAALVGPAGPVYEERVAGHEERVYYGTEAFQVAIEQKMTSTVRKVFAIALGVPEEEAGNAMDPGRMIEYQTAVGVAWSIAQGVDPTDAARVLQRATEAAAAARLRMASELSRTMVKAEG